jgi:hypothetical protein
MNEQGIINDCFLETRMKYNIRILKPLWECYKYFIKCHHIMWYCTMDIVIDFLEAMS